MRIIENQITNFDEAKSICKKDGNAELLQFREEEDFLILNAALSTDPNPRKNRNFTFLSFSYIFITISVLSYVTL